MTTAIAEGQELVEAEASRRRTFAIISHPDAGKTTLTEKFLLYSGAVNQAGSVKARSGRRSARSDWMEMEQQRGISVASTALQFDYRGHVVNLLDTPGHRDFSEDTYRVLAAVDAAVMVLDTAKGIEAQTLKLFEVCRSRHMPVLTFLNKFDRPGRDPLELLDEIEDQIGLRPTPITWPVGIPGDFRGVIDRRTGGFVRFTRTVRGATAAPEEDVDPDRAEVEEGDAWRQAAEEVELLDEVGANLDAPTFLSGKTSPLFVGSALTNFGVRHLLDGVIDIAPAPEARLTAGSDLHPIDEPFSGFVFKVQANMDKSHRDRLAFVRVNSGHFERGMTVTHQRTGKPFSTKYASSVFGSERDTIDNAYPGDVVGLVNATGLQIGDTLFAGSEVEFPAIPRFEPEVFSVARPRDVSRFKQFRRGLAQLEEEGVLQVLRDGESGDVAPVLAAVGAMQFEVFAHRLENEFGATVELSATPYTVARRTDDDTATELRAISGVRIMESDDGTQFALFESIYRLQRLQNENPDWCLERIVAA
ncbi:MAG: peptide chain release factor 3 [Acidimicrobiia bacterium]|nr:peptide chain release factor 3 [Acidimicrobiia bacterium]